MNLETVLKVLQRALTIVGIGGSVALNIRRNVALVIQAAEAKAGKQLGDMTDDELADLLDTPTATPDDLIGDTD